MDAITLPRLRELDSSLDLFDTPPYSPDLLSRGIYPVLAVSPERLLWGFPILRTALELKLPALYCRSYPESGTAAAFKIALGLENRAGKYSWAEKERFLTFINGLQESGLHLARLLEGREEAGIAEKYRRYGDLCTPLKTLITENFLNFKTALEIEDLPPQIFTRFLAAAKDLKFSFSEKRIFLVSFFELCQRDNLSSSAIQELFEQILTHPTPLKELKRLRYPCLSRMEEQFNHFKQNYLPGTGIELKAPEYFEGNSFYAGFSFTPKNLARKLQSMQKILEHIDELDILL